MILDLNKLSKKSIESTTVANKMQLSKDAQALIFNMFINNKYSNPIGSIVREITSNCFDSHVEAGVDNPVLIRKVFDEESSMYNLSFIDFGVGMSPERINKTYCTFFESTKRNDNSQIGGYGIGSKSILAYKRKIGYGSDEYDNSFFIITVFDNIKYYYCVYEGNESPEINLMFSENTDEKNGTEIRIPVLKSDIGRFETEIVKQLYYFENIVFDGFDDTHINNNYRIYDTQNFLFRGNDVSKYAHVCLGRVAYKIDYSVLNLNETEYQFPVALKFQIGDLGVNDSREQLDYSESTIKILKQRLKDLKMEFSELLSKQCDGIVSLEEYLESQQNKMLLKLTDNNTINLNFMSNDVNIKYKNFKYNYLEHIPNDETLFGLFFNSTIMGGRESRWEIRNNRGFGKNLNALKNSKNLYYLEGDYKRNNLKLSYLKSIHNRYYLIRKNEFFNDNSIQKLFKNPLFTSKDIEELMNDYWEIIKSYAKDFNDINIPETFKIERKHRAKINGEVVLNIVSDSYGVITSRVKISDLIDFNGTIIYGTKEESHELRKYADLAETILEKQIITDYNKNFIVKYRSKNNNPNFRLLFVYVAKNNIKYFSECKKAINIKNIEAKLFYRFQEKLKEIYCSVELNKKVCGINKIFLNKYFITEFPNISDEIELCNKLRKNGDVHSYTLTKYFTTDVLKNNKLYDEMLSKIQKIQKIDNYFSKYIEYINIPYYPENNIKFYEMIKILGAGCDELK